MVLALVPPYEQKGAVDKVSWSTVLLVGGVITYIAVVRKSGAIDTVGQSVSASERRCWQRYCSATSVVWYRLSPRPSRFSAPPIPLAVPFLQQGQIGWFG